MSTMKYQCIEVLYYHTKMTRWTTAKDQDYCKPLLWSNISNPALKLKEKQAVASMNTGSHSFA